MCERTAWRLCSAHQLWSSCGRKRGKNAKCPGPAVHDDLGAHIDDHGRTRTDFIGAARGVNQVWVTDTTEHPTGEGKLYFCAVKDTLSNRLVDCSAAPPMRSRLPVTAPNTAVARRKINRRSVTGWVVHSDHGSQSRSRRYRQMLGRHGLKGSTGRVASAGDNTAMESFFSLLQRKCLEHQDMGQPRRADHCGHRLDRTPLPPAWPTKTL